MLAASAPLKEPQVLRYNNVTVRELIVDDDYHVKRRRERRKKPDRSEMCKNLSWLMKTVLFVLCLFLIIPVVNIIVAVQYRDQISCEALHPAPSVPPPTPTPPKSNGSTTATSTSVTTTVAPAQRQPSSSSPSPPPSPPVFTKANLVEKVGVFAWCIVYGVTGIVEVLMIAVFDVAIFADIFDTSAEYFDQEAAEKTILVMLCSRCFGWLVQSFRFAWLVLGAVLLWAQCPYLRPKPLHDLMYATIVIGLVGACFWLFYRCYAERGTRRRRKR